MVYEKKPWLKYYGSVPHEIDFPRKTMYETVVDAVAEYPDSIAYDFMGKTATYREFKEQIDRCADALASLGLKKGDRFTISMPTSPPGIICFYALNKLGAVASMIHPLSTETEIEFYLKISKSRFALTLDIFYDTFKRAADKAGLEKLIISKMQDYLPLPTRIAYWAAKGRKTPPVPASDKVIMWKDLVIKGSTPRLPRRRWIPTSWPLFSTAAGPRVRPRGLCSPTTTLSARGSCAPSG